MKEDGASQAGVYILGITIPLAIVGNILTFVVFHKGHVCKTSHSSIYFKALAAVDIYVLLFPGLEKFIYDLNIDYLYRNLHTILCKFAVFNLYFAVEFSTWITVAMTIDRTLCVCFPLSYLNRSTKSIYIKLIAIGIFFAFCNVYTITYFEVLEYTTYTGNYTGNVTLVESYCSAPNYKICTLLDIINMSIFIFGLPLTVNTICNTLLLRKLYRRITKYQSSELTHAQIVTRSSVANSVTYRVIAISTVHLLTTGPFAVFHIYFYVVNWNVSKMLFQIDSILNVLYYMNSAVNFLLYCGTGIDFRRDMIAILRRKRHVHRNSCHASSTSI